jgi:hypothetical protein
MFTCRQLCHCITGWRVHGTCNFGSVASQGDPDDDRGVYAGVGPTQCMQDSMTERHHRQLLWFEFVSNWLTYSFGTHGV